MSEFLKWLDRLIAELEANLAKFRAMRQALIDSPEFDSADSEAADKLIRDTMPKD